jgi:hypothetical protein
LSSFAKGGGSAFALAFGIERERSNVEKYLTTLYDECYIGNDRKPLNAGGLPLVASLFPILTLRVVRFIGKRRNAEDI